MARANIFDDDDDKVVPINPAPTSISTTSRPIRTAAGSISMT